MNKDSSHAQFEVWDTPRQSHGFMGTGGNRSSHLSESSKSVQESRSCSPSHPRMTRGTGRRLHAVQTSRVPPVCSPVCRTICRFCLQRPSPLSVAGGSSEVLMSGITPLLRWGRVTVSHTYAGISRCFVAVYHPSLTASQSYVSPRT